MSFAEWYDILEFLSAGDGGSAALPWTGELGLETGQRPAEATP